MIVRGRGSKMPCESCAVQFSVFRRKRACSECERYYCAGCLRRGGGAMCAPCRALSTRPLARPAIAHLKVRDLQCFLQRQNVSTRGCVEKEELVSLCVSHVNSAAYRRRAPRAEPFPSLKGITSNINNFINSTFDLRPPPRPQQQRPQPNTNGGGCYNAAHQHAQAPAPAQAPRRERFTPTPGGQERISVPVPPPTTPGAAEPAHVDTADCLEVEDLDDSGWEFVRRPADPLPNDSDVLLASPGALGGPGTPLRAASSLELRSPEPHHEPAREPDRASLQDEPLDLPPSSRRRSPPRRAPSPRRLSPPGTDSTPQTPTHLIPPKQDGNDSDSNTGSQSINLEDVKDVSALDVLSVRQLKELLVRNRVEIRGCIERQELLVRAQRLWQDHARYKDAYC
ncbi:E3 ubiquitin-protein ligase rififylin [Leguminivora glycinivorella]|uniref:E3 ubiquitin-protein ligase rififylin n=1 Tax=Leguminivora glycinivorella TaxID=1035111 RepID=UPI00200EEAED|nr:E3 ubiquitin-protein ligase rififylin [Leguminivora glycinivorella]